MVLEIAARAARANPFRPHRRKGKPDGMLRIALADADATRALGARLAALLRPRDVVLLEGDLGAGKTELARGCIQALSGAAVDVPSPTFNLLLTYDTPAGSVWHFDLYRVERPGELEELGVDEAFADGISLVEWPDRLPAPPRGALRITLRNDGAGRSAEFDGGGTWPARLAGFA